MKTRLEELAVIIIIILITVDKIQSLIIFSLYKMKGVLSFFFWFPLILNNNNNHCNDANIKIVLYYTKFHFVRP